MLHRLMTVLLLLSMSNVPLTSRAGPVAAMSLTEWDDDSAMPPDQATHRERTKGKHITVVIADDNPFVREGVRSILDREPDISVIGVAKNGEEALRLVEQHHPTVLVTDVNMPKLNGFDMLRKLKQRELRTKVVILTASTDRHVVLPLLQLGATGYALKDSTVRDLTDTIRAVAAGRIVVAPQVATLVLEAHYGEQQPEQQFGNLTARERDVLALLAQGYSNGQIAARLCIGIKTVGTHRSNLYRKLGVHNVGELIRVALLHDLIQFD